MPLVYSKFGHLSRAKGLLLKLDLLSKSSLGLLGVNSWSTTAYLTQTLSGHRKQTQGLVGVCLLSVRLDPVGTVTAGQINIVGQL